MTRPNLVVSFLASHGGSAVKQIVSAINNGELNASCGIVITNNKDSEIYRWCTENDIQKRHISGSTHPQEEHKDLAIDQALSAAGTDIVVLSGYMKKIGPVTLKNFEGNILNIHPSLLPKHGGKGLYGDRVHESVLRSGDAETGATVHIINEEYDEGPIVAQHFVSVDDGETVATLKTKVQAIEGPLYVAAIRSLADQYA